MFTRFKNIFCAGLIAAAAFTTSAMAETVLYENPNVGTTAGGPCSPCGSDFRSATSFTLGDDSTIGAFEAQLHDITSGGMQDVLIEVFSGDLTTSLWSQLVTTADYTKDTTLGGSYPVVLFDVADFALTAGSYFVSLYGVNGTQFGWPTSPTPTAGSEWIQVSGNNLIGGTPQNGGLGIRVLGTVDVPAPAPLALLGLGIFAIARRRKS